MWLKNISEENAASFFRLWVNFHAQRYITSKFRRVQHKYSPLCKQSVLIPSLQFQSQYNSESRTTHNGAGLHWYDLIRHYSISSVANGLICWIYGTMIIVVYWCNRRQICPSAILAVTSFPSTALRMCIFVRNVKSVSGSLGAIFAGLKIKAPLSLSSSSSQSSSST